MKFSLYIDTVTDIITNNIVAPDYFSTLTAYDAVIDVAYTVLSKAVKVRRRQESLKHSEIPPVINHH